MPLCNRVNRVTSSHSSHLHILASSQCPISHSTELRANLRETFVGVLDSPQRGSQKVTTDASAAAIVPPYQGQGVATVYLLEDGVGKSPAVDFSILIGNLIPGGGGRPSSINIVREEVSTADAVIVQQLCADVSTTPKLRKCSVGSAGNAGSPTAGCFGNVPPNTPNTPNPPEVLAGGGSAATTTDIGVCGPFTPIPLRTVRTPTGARTAVGGGAVMEFLTDGKDNIANETVRAMRTRRAAIHVTNQLQGLLVQGTLQPAVAIAYALPPLATKPASLTGRFSTFSGPGSSASGSASGIASVRVINPRSFAYVLELYELSGVPTQGMKLCCFTAVSLLFHCWFTASRSYSTVLYCTLLYFTAFYCLLYSP